MSHSYTGRILRVDLTTSTTSVWEPDREFYRKYLGGKNWGLYVLLHENPPGISAFDPENRLVLMTSVLTGTPVPGACRFTAASKSPLTDAYAESEAGGFWGPELKFAGFDGIVIHGQAEKPVYLWITDGEAEIRPADALWGRTTGEVQEAIRKELKDERIRILQCGPAGEKLIRFANIVNELKHFNGRTGIGAVMGSKRLRAIAVRGKNKPALHNRDAVMAKVKWFVKRLKTYEGAQSIQELGTAAAVNPLQSMGMLPAYNFRDGGIDQAELVSAETIRDTIKHSDEGCYGCPVRCKKTVEVKGKYNVDSKYGGPEYETICAFGPLCGILDPEAIAKANEICNQNAMDTISTGVTIAFAMECAEKNLLGELLPEGLNLQFGDAEAMVKLVSMIADRTPGLGDTLAQGSHRAAEKIGGRAAGLCMTVKKQELPLHDPRGKWGVALGFAVSPSGADHLVMAHDPSFENAGEMVDELKPLGITRPVPSQSIGEEKIRLDTVLQCAWSLYNVLGLCIFVGVPERKMFTFLDIAELISDAAGFEIDIDEMMTAAERSINLARLFNIREGFTAEDDKLPKRFFRPVRKGALKGVAVPEKEFEEGVRTYYRMRGWTRDGVPTPEKLSELGISWAASAPLGKDA